MHSIKINRAFRTSAIGNYRASALAMLDIVPSRARSKLSGSELGELLDALWTACQQAKAIAAADAIAEGAVWDHRAQTFRELRA